MNPQYNENTNETASGVRIDSVSLSEMLQSSQPMKVLESSDKMFHE